MTKQFFQTQLQQALYCTENKPGSYEGNEKQRSIGLCFFMQKILKQTRNFISCHVLKPLTKKFEQILWYGKLEYQISIIV